MFPIQCKPVTNGQDHRRGERPLTRAASEAAHRTQRTLLQPEHRLIPGSWAKTVNFGQWTSRSMNEQINELP